MPEASGARAGLSYQEAGVDRTVAEQAKRRIAALVRSTASENVLSRPGGFGGLFRVPRDLHSPVLVASADGVGTKLKVAMRAGRHDTVGIDLVNHCANDILVEGARPLFFLDYIGMGRLDAAIVEQLVEGLAAGCRENGCALLGGETAEMPDFYAPGEYDLAGFIVGAVEEQGRPGADRVLPGDVLIGLASGGFHTNGYSLLRRLLFDRLKLDVDDRFPDQDASVADVLLRPHRAYAGALLPLIAAGRIHALAHITGGGLPGNLERVLPENADARVDLTTWDVPAVFCAIMEYGGVDRDEMFHTFNMGVGMVLIVASDETDAVFAALTSAGERAWRMGTVEPGSGRVVLS